MPTSTNAPSLSSTRIGVFGHPSADPQSVATAFGASTHQKANPELDLAIFAINPNTGIEAESIQTWADLDEFQIPRLVVVTGLEEGDGVGKLVGAGVGSNVGVGEGSGLGCELGDGVGSGVG